MDLIDDSDLSELGRDEAAIPAAINSALREAGLG
jgi:hypothetical protein